MQAVVLALALFAGGDARYMPPALTDAELAIVAAHRAALVELLAKRKHP